MEYLPFKDPKKYFSFHRNTLKTNLLIHRLSPKTLNKYLLVAIIVKHTNMKSVKLCFWCKQENINPSDHDTLEYQTHRNT